MNKKKLVTAWVSLSALILAMVSFPLSVNSGATPLSDIIPADVYGVLELNPTELSSKLQDLYVTGLGYVIENALIPYYADEENTTELNNFYSDLYGSQITTVGVTSSVLTPAAFIFTEIEEADFNSLVELYGDNIDALFTADDDDTYYYYYEDEEDIIKGEDEGDSTLLTTAEIYQPETFSDTYFMYHDGYFVVSSEISFLEELAVGFNDTLTDNDTYQDISDEFLNDYFLSGYVDLELLLNNVSLNSMYGVESESTVLEAFKSVGFSFNQTLKGISFQEYVITDEDVLESLGLDYSDNAKVPYLYELMPSSNPILYFEGFNLSEAWNSVSEIDNTADELDASFRETLGVGINDYLVPLLSKGFALLIQDSDNFLPSLNILVDVTGNESLATEIINKMTSAALEMESDENANLTVTNQEMLGGNFSVISLELTEEDSNNPYAIKTPEEWLKMSLTMGITGDNNLLISTNPNIEEEYGEDLINDDDFDIAFNENGGAISYLAYLNFGNISSWAQGILSDWEDYDSTGIANFDEAQNSIKQFFSIFDEIYTVTVQTNNYANATSNWNFNIDEVENLVGYFNEMQAAVSFSMDAMNNSTTNFEDVPSDEWYSEDVYYLATTGVVAGYGDETYQPSNEITRAEFLTMLIRVLEEKGYASGDSWYYCWEDCSGFDDVDYYDWYGSYIYEAYNLGIVSGYEDGTFQPNALITRAEAVSMITKALSMVDIGNDFNEKDLPDFIDVNEEDWYYDVVDTARRYNIVEGTTESTFEPLRNLNRAESAKIIRLTLELIN